jgi:hypothetical protein
MSTSGARVGDHRILYRIDVDRLVVLIIRIAHRLEVYRCLPASSSAPIEPCRAWPTMTRSSPDHHQLALSTTMCRLRGPFTRIG